KPKYHLLCHTAFWIERYGVLSNTHVEDEERMNSSVRSNLEHSDRQAPSKDLAYCLANAQGLRFVALGGIWVDPKTNLLTQA
ncbi:hypothetical protein L873DRAFT_1610469, partial [Choiromyces venosus 120613-1]